MKTKPTVTMGKMGSGEETIKTHPSYAALRINRVSGSKKLFASEVQAGSYIKLEILQNEEHWHLHQKWYYPHKPIIEIEMTHAQFAEAITSLNMHNGVPCTLTRLQGQKIEDCEDNDTNKDLIKADINKLSEGLVESMKALKTAFAELKLTKKEREPLAHQIDHLITELNANLPFITEQHQEQAEKLTSDAKIEVEAFINHRVVELGLDKLNEIKSLQ